MATTTREQITSTVISILDAIKAIISSHANTPRVTASLRALTSIATTLVAGEENAMTTLLPHLVASTKVEGLTTHALATLSPFPYVPFHFFLVSREAKPRVAKNLGLAFFHISAKSSKRQLTSCAPPMRHPQRPVRHIKKP